MSFGYNGVGFGGSGGGGGGGGGISGVPSFTVSSSGSLTSLVSAVIGSLGRVPTESTTYVLHSLPASNISNWLALPSGSSATQGAIVSAYQNTSGSTIAAFLPVQINSATGSLALVDVSVLDSSQDTFGVTQAAIANGAYGNVVMEGRLENITGGFLAGSVLWVAKNGSLTATAPNAGINGFVSGDLVIKVGVVVPNVGNALLVDLVVEMDIIGAL